MAYDDNYECPNGDYETYIQIGTTFETPPTCPHDGAVLVPKDPFRASRPRDRNTGS